MIDAPSAIVSLLASRPASQFIADLFTFTLRSGDTYRFTSSPQPIIIGGNTYSAGVCKIQRGRIKLSRGLSVDSQQITLTEPNGAFIERAMLGYFNLALYTLGRVFKADAAAPWLGPVTRFAGQVASVDEVGLTYAKMTVKSMLNILDNDFPRTLLQNDCPHVLYDQGCGLTRAAHLVSGTIQAGTTQNRIASDVTSKPDGWFSLGILNFTSGQLAGVAYMVKISYATGVIYPAYPLLAAPAAGDTFSISAGCDKTLGTCQSKFGQNPASTAPPYFGGTPFIPDPTTIY
jgi:uncharacterized phage protein (TIGR02218 family)